jgi:hypothetical protein
VKIRLVALFLVAGSGCASPQLGSRGLPVDQPDLAVGVGSNGGDDMAVADRVDQAMPLPTTDMAVTPAVDMAVTPPPPDMAQPPLPDMAQPPPPPDMAQPPPPDMACARNPGSSTCGTSPQCGCTSGQNCNVEKDDGTAQCALAGTTAVGTICDPKKTGTNGDGVCVVDSACVAGVCQKFCTVDADCGAGQFCVQVANSSNTSIPGFKVCTYGCDPTNPSSTSTGYAACGSGATCITSGSATVTSTFCVGPSGTGKQGTDCLTTSGGDQTICAPGYQCDPTNQYCYKFCHVSKTGECGTGTTCRSQSPKQYAGAGTEIGTCH